MAISKIELFRDDTGRTVERRTDVETNEVSFFGHFKDVVYNVTHNLTANVLVDLQANTVEFAFQTFDEKLAAKQTQMTLSFLEFLEQNPDRKAAMEAIATKKTQQATRVKTHVPLTGDRHVTSPETANVGKAPSVFRVQ
jgi:hypothetical protein